jgi:hypothetical protein
MLFHVIYLSSARTKFTAADLNQLLAHSRQANEKVGITGILLYRDGNFLQVIEGEREAVMRLYQKIGKDPRHTGILSLFQEEIPEREFPEWSMGFRDLAKQGEDLPEGYNTILNGRGQAADLEGYAAKVRAFMQMFVK